MNVLGLISKLIGIETLRLTVGETYYLRNFDQLVDILYCFLNETSRV